MVEWLPDSNFTDDRKEEVICVVVEFLLSANTLKKDKFIFSKIVSGEAKDERNEEGKDVENFSQAGLANLLGNINLANHDVAIDHNGDWNRSIEVSEEGAIGQLDTTKDIIIPDAFGMDESEA